jgi:hypothetical protein
MQPIEGRKYLMDDWINLMRCHKVNIGSNSSLSMMYNI